MGPVTENPFLIAIINLSIVFGVLIALGVLMTLLQYVDPTKKKSKPVAAPAPAAAPAAPVAAPAADQDNNEIIAVIAAAVAACGVSSEQIAFVRRVDLKNSWTMNARAEAISVRKECF